MDDFSNRYSKFCENIWKPFFAPYEHLYPGRKSCSFRMWYSRSRAAQHVMYRYLVDNGGLSPPRNPFFWIQHFPEPVPTNYNHTAEGREMLDNQTAAIALYNGVAGIYKNEDILFFNLQVKQQPSS